MKPGVYPNHSRDRYDAFGAVNWSTLKALKKSALHYQHCLAEPPTQSPAMLLGEATHVAVLEPDKFAAEWTNMPDFGDCRRKENKADRDAWLAAHDGSHRIISADFYARACGMRDAVRANHNAARYLADGAAEVSLVWERCGMTCKGRIDWDSRSGPAIVDLKTTQSIARDKFQRQAANLGYHSQLAFYQDGYKRATGQIVLPVILIAVESEPPHDVAVYRYDEDALYYGNEEIDELLRHLDYCRKQDRWPGMYDGELTLTLPTWMTGDEDDDIAGMGLRIGGGKAA